MTIVSGGQTGVDRAAWDVALELGLPISGWVPKGRLAEDGVIPAHYGTLREAESPEPPVRTRLNVRDSDATLIISRDRLTGGSLLTLAEAHRLGRPALHIDVRDRSDDEAARLVQDWLAVVRPAVLNVAGPRASGDPTISARAAAILRIALASALESS
jgi:predicted Rossmann fold nucleotide-binding protein DprA/Smf involved in DNA uptake